MCRRFSIDQNTLLNSALSPLGPLLLQISSATLSALRAAEASGQFVMNASSEPEKKSPTFLSSCFLFSASSERLDFDKSTSTERNLDFGTKKKERGDLERKKKEEMGMGTSTFIIRWVNFLTMLLAIVVVVFGVWMSTHHDGCRRSLTLPVIGIGAVIFLISIIGFLGAMKNSSILLWIVSLYLILLCFILVGILVFTVLAFIVTNNGSGHSVVGLRYKEYQLHDYSPWFLKQLNNTQNWKHLKSCLVKSNDCNDLPKKYKTLKQYKLAKLTPVEAGCCRPPSECGYPAVNASYYDMSFHPVSSNKDCKLYKNARDTKCYNCDSCKAGVAQYMKTEWRLVAIFNVALFVVLSMIYFVGCCARRNAARVRSKN